MLAAQLEDAGLGGDRDAPEGIWVMSHSVTYACGYMPRRPLQREWVWGLGGGSDPQV